MKQNYFPIESRFYVKTEGTFSPFLADLIHEQIRKEAIVP